MAKEKKELIKKFNVVVEDLLDHYDEYTDEEGGFILSYLSGTTFPGYIYYFASEALVANSIVIDINQTEAWEAFMYQFYADLEEDEEWYYLINGNTTAEATIAVQYGWNDETSIIATFMPLTEETRSGDIKAMFNAIDKTNSVLVNRK